MHHSFVFSLAVLAATLPALSSASGDHGQDRRDAHTHARPSAVQVGPRPYFLVKDMEEGKLKHLTDRLGARIELRGAPGPPGAA